MTSPVSVVPPSAPILDRSRRFLPPGTEELAGQGWRLRRAWPRGADHLLLDLLDPDGRQVAGQWLADPERAAHVAARTPGADVRGAVVLQPDGADRRLRPLADLLRRPEFTLVGHRPEKRAVLAGQDRFVKVLRPERLPAAASRARVVAGMNIGAPEVLDVDPVRGLLVTRALPGRSLTDLLPTAQAEHACHLAGTALARLHALPVPDHEQGRGAEQELTVHGPAQELAVIERWHRQVAQHVPGWQTAGLMSGPLSGPLSVPQLPSLPPLSRRTLLHRDLHDGQLLVDGDRIGMIDCDLLAVGDPALDLANLLVHLELRGEQGLIRPGSVPGLRAAVLDGYRPDVHVRAHLPAYAEVARMRLRAVYALRDPELVS
jgi:Ser/Thr protein kinase RdoA (MazF antagonist)